MAVDTKTIINSFIAVLVGIVLAPIIYTVAADANVSGTAATVLALVPTLFILGILLLSVRTMQ